MNAKINVIVWNEFRHERQGGAAGKVYPQGIHAAIAQAMSKQDDIVVSCATLDEPEHGLSEDSLKHNDVLIWWGHLAHNEVGDQVVDRVQKHVLEGMGLIVLHSAHHSRIFRRLMGTCCDLRWREAGEKERLWNIQPAHPIAKGIGDYIELPNTEMYGERFDIPTPDELVFISWFQGGEVFRSGCCWQRGHGRVFYFRPGHETFPIYHDRKVQQVLVNAVRWARPRIRRQHGCPCVPQPLERIESHQG